MTELAYTEKLAVVHCTCGMAFALPGELNQRALDEGISLCCPLGHKWHYTETWQQKLRKEREKSARLRAQLDQTEASLIAQRGATTRVKNKLKRVEAGVCPHCNRTFQNLARHMESKHHQ